MNAMRSVGALVLLVAGGLSTGCQSRMFDENKQLHNQNRQLQTELDSERRARMAAEQRASSADPGQLTAMQGEIAELRGSGSDQLDGPVHDLVNAVPYLFDEPGLERAVAGIERLVGA